MEAIKKFITKDGINGVRIQKALGGSYKTVSARSKSHYNKMRRRRQKRKRIIRMFCYVDTTLVASLSKDERRAINIR